MLLGARGGGTGAGSLPLELRRAGSGGGHGSATVFPRRAPALRWPTSARLQLHAPPPEKVSRSGLLFPAATDTKEIQAEKPKEDAGDS